MATDYNHIAIMGRCTRDPEIKYGANNFPIVTGGMASDMMVKNKQTDAWEAEPGFFEYKILGKSGEAFAKYHSKGSKMFIAGRLKHESWNDKATQAKRSRHVIIADLWQFVGNKPKTPQDETGRDDGGASAVPYQDSPF